MPRVAFQKTQLLKMTKGLRESRAAGARGCEQGGLAPRNTFM